MNRINFTKGPSFPLSSNTMEFMQDIILENLAAFTALGGERYILSGCQESGSAVSPGYIVIGNQLLPFVGGTKNASIVITQETRDIVADGDTYSEAYVKRAARFGTGSPQYDWSSFKRITDLLSLRTLIDNLANVINAQATVPTGTVTSFAGASEPTGWLFCKGQSLKVAEYQNLFNLIGYANGGSGADFNVPNLCGRFIVGVGASNLTNGDTNHTYPLNGKGGENAHKLSIYEMPKHDHGRYVGQDRRGTKGTASLWSNFNSDKFFASLGYTGGDERHENRPPYHALNYIIKY